MKKFTISFILLLVLATAGALVFVGLSPGLYRAFPAQRSGGSLRR